MCNENGLLSSDQSEEHQVHYKKIYQGAGREFNLYSAMRLSHLWGEAEEGPSREEEEEAEEAERISICCCKCCWIC